MKEERPWGTHETFLSHRNYKIKLLEINPMEMTSLQYHNYRSEHWIVVHGVAKVTVNDSSQHLQKGDYMYVEEKAVHQIKNQTQSSLVILELQMGTHLSEDDIVRIEDKYGRD